jgi:hypothetical protein
MRRGESFHCADSLDGAQVEDLNEELLVRDERYLTHFLSKGIIQILLFHILKHIFIYC